MNRLVELTFKNRSYDEAFIANMEDDRHALLKDIDILCSELKTVHDKNLPITIYPDFDMDGIASGVLGFAGLAELGFRVNLFVPDPGMGYGITVESIKTLMSQYPDTKAVITCDTGIDAYEAIDYCNTIGVRVFVTDHHLQDRIVNASVIVDPCRTDETYEHSAICGAFVFYQVLMRYAQLYGNYFICSQINRLGVFAGIGTVSDMMPVLYENRGMIRDAVSICKLLYSETIIETITGCDIYKKSFMGLYYVMKVLDDYGVLHDLNEVDENLFGFYIAPMFNSVKRMNGDLSRAFRVFFGDTPYEDADYLYNLNLQRKLSVESAYNDIMSVPQPYAPYIYLSNAGSGVLGLLAQKLMQSSNRPVVVLKQDVTYHGSGRCPSWYTASEEEKTLLHKKGHEQSYGCGVNSDVDLKRLFELISQTCDACSANVPQPVYDFVINPDWSADTGIDIDLFYGYLKEMSAYHPFGKGFPAPCIKFEFTNHDVIEWKQMGKNKQHLKIVFPNGFEAICWNKGNMKQQIVNDNKHVMSGHLEKSVFQDRESINFIGDFL